MTAESPAPADPEIEQPQKTLASGRQIELPTPARSVESPTPAEPETDQPKKTLESGRQAKLP
jgi:hypothetical protein